MPPTRYLSTTPMTRNVHFAHFLLHVCEIIIRIIKNHPSWDMQQHFYNKSQLQYRTGMECKVEGRVLEELWTSLHSVE